MRTIKELLERLVNITNRDLVYRVEEEVECVTYCDPNKFTVVCQLHLKNGYICEGTAIGGGQKNYLRLKARKDAVANLLKIKRYCKFEQIYRKQCGE